MITILFWVVLAQAFDMTLKHQDTRIFRYPISKQQNLLLDCEASLGRTYIITIHVNVQVSPGEDPIILTERRLDIEQPKQQLTVPHPHHINQYSFYLVTIRCESYTQQDYPVWNILSLSIHSDFDHIIDAINDPKLTEEQQKFNQIRNNALQISMLAEEHLEVQDRKRQQEDQADNNINNFNSSIVWYTVVEVLVILLTIVVELLMLKKFLKKIKVID